MADERDDDELTNLSSMADGVKQKLVLLAGMFDRPLTAKERKALAAEAGRLTPEDALLASIVSTLRVWYRLGGITAGAALCQSWRPIELAPTAEGHDVLLAVIVDGEIRQIGFGSYGFIETSDADGSHVFGWKNDQGIDEPTHFATMPALDDHTKGS